MLALPNLFKHVMELKFSLIQGSKYAEDNGIGNSFLFLPVIFSQNVGAF
jgi:hypothetical protein